MTLHNNYMQSTLATPLQWDKLRKPLNEVCTNATHCHKQYSKAKQLFKAPSKSEVTLASSLTMQTGFSGRNIALDGVVP